MDPNINVEPYTFKSCVVFLIITSMVIMALDFIVLDVDTYVYIGLLIASIVSCGILLKYKFEFDLKQ